MSVFSPLYPCTTSSNSDLCAPWDMTHSHDTWPVHMCDMTPCTTSSNSGLCETHLFHMRHVFIYVYVCIYIYIYIYMLTRLHVTHDSPCNLFQQRSVCTVTLSYRWYGLFTHALLIKTNSLDSSKEAPSEEYRSSFTAIVQYTLVEQWCSIY